MGVRPPAPTVPQVQPNNFTEGMASEMPACARSIVAQQSALAAGMGPRAWIVDAIEAVFVESFAAAFVRYHQPNCSRGTACVKQALIVSQIVKHFNAQQADGWMRICSDLAQT